MPNDYACALLVRDRRILLGLRAPERRLYPSRWDVFGGRVEDGETIGQALSRELGEELGIVPVSIRPAGVVEDQVAHLSGTLVYHMFIVEEWSGGEPRLTNAEHTRLAWFTPDEACALTDLAVASYADLFRRVAAMIDPAK
jgi:8-oxo-dGTP pyrophosphatase MutT (NUDIX family)